MKVVQMLGDRKVAVVDLPLPELSPGEVLIRVQASAICGSEKTGYIKGSRTNNGHEICGVVEEVYETKRLRPGDHVGGHDVQGCGSCQYCMRGIPTWCKHRSSALGWRADGYGGHAEFVKLQERWCYRLPTDIPFSVGALLTGDGLGVPFHAAKSIEITDADTTCVFGCGPIGLGNILLQTFYGARVIAVDINPLRLEMAKACGALLTIDASKENPEAIVEDYTHGLGVDKAFECSGQPVPLNQAIKLVKPGGIVVCIGEQGETPIHIGNQLIRRDICIRGSWFYHFNEIPEMMRLYERGLQVDKLITNTFPIEEAQTAFDRFFGGLEGKVVLEPSYPSS